MDPTSVEDILNDALVFLGEAPSPPAADELAYGPLALTIAPKVTCPFAAPYTQTSRPAEIASFLCLYRI